MDNINFTSFKAFVMAQDESRTIDHCDWDTCSVRDYMNHIRVDMPSGMENNTLALILCDNNKELNDILGNAGVNGTMPAYKELQVVLTNYEEGKL